MAKARRRCKQDVCWEEIRFEPIVEDDVGSVDRNTSQRSAVGTDNHRPSNPPKFLGKGRLVVSQRHLARVEAFSERFAWVWKRSKRGAFFFGMWISFAVFHPSTIAPSTTMQCGQFRYVRGWARA